MTELRYDGRVAVITGAGRGLGRAYARLLAERGAKVVVNNRGRDAAEQVVEEIKRAGGMAVSDDTDIAEPEGAKRVIERAVGELGAIDIVIHNAGISIHREMADLDVTQFELMLRTHVMASFFLAQAAWPHMLAQNRGRILLTASGSGFWGQTSNHDYSAAKAGVYGLTRSLSIAGEGRNINVNCIAPRAGTDLAARTVKDPRVLEKLMNGMPPERVAPVAAWLTHDDCQINGQAFDAGGGLVRRIFVGLTAGDGAAELSPEHVRDRMSGIEDQTGYSVPDHAMHVALDVAPDTPAHN